MKDNETKVVTPFAPAHATAQEARGKAAPTPVRAVAPVGSQDIHVGPSTRLSGGFNTLGMMIVDGRVDDGDIAADRLVVSHIGELQGHATVHRAEISGVFDGDLVAADEVIVRPTARLAGRVRCQRLVIHRGARIECSFSCDAVDTETPATGERPAPARPSRTLSKEHRAYLAGVASVLALVGAASMLNSLKTLLLG